MKVEMLVTSLGVEVRVFKVGGSSEKIADFYGPVAGSLAAKFIENVLYAKNVKETIKSGLPDPSESSE